MKFPVFNKKQRYGLAAGIIAVLAGIGVMGVVLQAKKSGPTQIVQSKPAIKSVKPSQVKPAPVTPPSSQAATAPVISTPTRLIGIFVSDSPSESSSLQTLDAVHALGFNLVYNYSSIDGSPQQLKAYLDHASQLGMQVIISLNDLYDQLPDGAKTAQSYPVYGATNEAIALGVVRAIASHPATWGFSITDEVPETAHDIPQWLPILTERHAKIKAITSKPTMEVLVGASGDRPDRRNFLARLKPSADTLALDYYPVPYEPVARSSEFADDLTSIGVSQGWSVIQGFSWASYPETAEGLGYDVSKARTPTTSEMVTMGRLDLQHGTPNLLFYSYFDIKDNPLQLAAVAAAVAQLKN